MRVELNLASRPVENRRRFYALAGTSIAILLALALLQATAFFGDWWSGRDAGRRISQLQAELTRLEDEQRKLEEQLKEPQARDVMEHAYFLNSLILQKSISWTKIFMDMEKIVPDRVQVVSIRPEVLDTNQMRLDMNVSGETMEQLLDFLRRVEKSDKFGTPVLAQEVPPAIGSQDLSIRLGLSVLYAQK